MTQIGKDISERRFLEPAQNDANGQCLHCGRDNQGYEGHPCSDDCPYYWEERGLSYEAA